MAPAHQPPSDETGVGGGIDRLVSLPLGDRIETLFHVLKNGCRVEALQLDSLAKLQLALALYLVVSWRIAHLVRIGRIHPDLPADFFFAETEWTGACVLNEKKPPKQPPPVRDVVRLIAQPGGFLGRQGR